MATLQSPNTAPAPPEGSGGVVWFVSPDRALNMQWKCHAGHRHQVWSGNKQDGNGLPAGTPFSLPAECADEFWQGATPNAHTARVSGQAATYGTVPGLRRLT